MKSWFGGGEMEEEVEGGMILKSGIKKSYNKNVKNTQSESYWDDWEHEIPKWCCGCIEEREKKLSI